MSNTLLTPTLMAPDAGLILKDKLVVANLVNRSAEKKFVTKKGDTVNVYVPVAGAAEEFSLTTNAVDVTETAVEVVMQKHFDYRIDLTSDQLSMEMDDFNTRIQIPAITALIKLVEPYLLGKVVGGFSRNMSGTAGTDPTTHAHIIAAEKTIFDNYGDTSQLVSVLGSTPWASFKALNIMNSLDFREDGPSALKTMELGQTNNISFFRSVHSGTFDFGDWDDSSTTATTLTTSTSVTIASLAEATGTIPEGVRFAIAGVTGTFTVTKDATIASNAATVVVDSTPDAAVSTAACTSATAHTENVVYDPNAVAAAILPGAPGPNAAIASIDGMGLRIIQSNISTSTLAQSWVWDLYVGCKVVQSASGCILQG